MDPRASPAATATDEERGINKSELAGSACSYRPDKNSVEPADITASRPSSYIRSVASAHAIHAVSASETVQATVGQTAEELQAAAETTARWTMVRDELKATLDGVTSAVLTMKHSLGQSVLLTYTVSKKLVKVPQHANLLPHVAPMRKTNRFGRSRKAQTPAPPPTPALHV